MAVNIGQGTILKATISSTLTAIFQLLEVEGPEVTVGGKDKTALADVAVRMRAQLPAGGKPTFKVQFEPTDATQEWCYAQVVSFPQPAVAWRLICNTASGTAGFSFNAFISKFGLIGMNQEDNLEAELELTIDGVPTQNQ
jgi:hypothetical protein